MIKIYHNPRCSKSREGLKVLEDSGKNFEIVKYLEDVPTKRELREIIDLLGIKPEKLLRKSEAVWKDNYKGKSLSDNEVISIMVKNPRLIERPIVVKGNKALIGRPPNKILEII